MNHADDQRIERDEPIVSPVLEGSMHQSDQKGPRLQPIEKPSGFRLRMAYWATGRPFGKVPTNVKVLVARMPKSVKLFTEVGKFEMKSVRLEKDLHYMIATLVSGINGCGYCLDLSRAMAMKERMDMEKFNALPAYRESPLFSEKERAALAYAEEATRYKKVSDATFEELRHHFDDWEIVEITTIVAIHNFYNMLNIPLGIGSDGFCLIAQTRNK